ncbi:MAG: hypothetical protein R2932_49535 [Caldilineaceae bacterium]
MTVHHRPFPEGSMHNRSVHSALASNYPCCHTTATLAPVVIQANTTNTENSTNTVTDETNQAAGQTEPTSARGYQIYGSMVIGAIHIGAIPTNTLSGIVNDLVLHDVGVQYRIRVTISLPCLHFALFALYQAMILRNDLAVSPEKI